MTDRIAEDRLEKLRKLEAAGVAPYPPRVPCPTDVRSCLAGIEKREGERVTIAGRLGQVRDFGKLRFAHCRDRTGSIQVRKQHTKQHKKTTTTYNNNNIYKKTT